MAMLALSQQGIALYISPSYINTVQAAGSGPPGTHTLINGVVYVDQLVADIVGAVNEAKVSVSVSGTVNETSSSTVTLQSG